MTTMQKLRKKIVPPKKILLSDLSKFSCVEVIESESGWGQRVDETLYFRTVKDAEAFVREFNKDNTLPSAPVWYMRADLVKRGSV